MLFFIRLWQLFAVSVINIQFYGGNTMLSKNGIARLRRMNTEINVQSRNNAMYVGQVFQQVLESEAGDVTFATFEQALRDSNST